MEKTFIGDSRGKSRNHRKVQSLTEFTVDRDIRKEVVEM